MSIADPALEAAIAAEIDRAERNHGLDVRADERHSPAAVQVQRAMLRHAIQGALDRFVKEKHGTRTDARKGAIALQRALIDALGLQVAEGRIDGHRADSSFLPGELIARDQDPHRVRDQVRAVQELSSFRSIDASAQVYDTTTISYDGSTALYKPGQTEIPSADYATGTKKRMVHTLVTKTAIDWLEALLGSGSAINQAAEKAEAASRFLRDSWEDVLVLGAEGTDLLGLFGKDRIKLSAYHSAVDYADSATELDAIYADLIAAVVHIAESNNDRGPGVNAAMIAPQLVRRVLGKSNIGDGGSMTGAEVFMAMKARNESLGVAFENAGITSVVQAPSLNTVPGATGEESNRAGAVFFRAGDPRSIRRVLSMPPSPVRTVEALTGTETLWALRTGGLECQDPTSAGIATFKVR